jgi:hypothetical protein
MIAFFSRTHALTCRKDILKLATQLKGNKRWDKCGSAEAYLKSKSGEKYVEDIRQQELKRVLLLQSRKLSCMQEWTATISSNYLTITMLLRLGNDVLRENVSVRILLSRNLMDLFKMSH